MGTSRKPPVLKDAPEVTVAVRHIQGATEETDACVVPLVQALRAQDLLRRLGLQEQQVVVRRGVVVGCNHAQIVAEEKATERKLLAQALVRSPPLRGSAIDGLDVQAHLVSGAP